MQWTEAIGDRVESLEISFKEVREDLNNLSQQLTTAAAASQVLLQNINVCLIGTSSMGLIKGGLVDDVKGIISEQQRQGVLIDGNVDRLKSLERTRATIIWAGGALSTALTAVGFWVWSHTDQLLTTITTVYGRNKTEVSTPKVDSK